METEDDGAAAQLIDSYAYRERKGRLEPLPRWARASSASARSRRRRILLTSVPADYIQISSGLGEARRSTSSSSRLFEGEVKAVIELASFQPFSPIHQIFLDQLTESIGVVLNMIGANMRTEELLAAVAEPHPGAPEPVEGAHPAAGRAQALERRAREAGARARGEGARCSRSRTARSR